MSKCDRAAVCAPNLLFVLPANFVDGDFGLLSRDGMTTFESVTLSTDDPAYLYQNLPVGTGPSQGDTDLPGTILGQIQGDTVYIDDDRAGYGWFMEAIISAYLLPFGPKEDKLAGYCFGRIIE